MKSTAIYAALLISLLLSGCIGRHENFFQAKNQKKIIALQPIGDYDWKRLNFIKQEMTNFYNRKVVILQPINIPATFRLANDAEIYSADSILDKLHEILNDEIIEVVGLTHNDIFTLKKEKNQTKNPLSNHNVHSIFGLADYYGNCCIISDYRLTSDDISFFISFNHRLNQRLRSVVIHEIGHNIGLAHCSVSQCIMSDQNGNLSVLDNSGNDYCDNCKGKLED